MGLKPEKEREGGGVGERMQIENRQMTETAAPVHIV